MQILYPIYNKIISIPSEVPPETGGILGGSGGIVTEIVFDDGIQATCGCSYAPDVKKLNKVIEKWQEKKIEFMGIFHTHFFEVETLSNGDKEYIEKIIKSMPPYINLLYFPIVVMPKRNLVVYRAVIEKERLVIEKDKILVCRMERHYGENE